MADLTTKKKSRGGHGGLVGKLVTNARELVEGYDGERKSAIKQAKLALEEKLEQLKTLDEEIQIMICEDENSTQEALQEDMEASWKIPAKLQECVILIEDTLASGAETSDTPSTSNASIFESNTSTPQSTNIKARLPKTRGKKIQWQSARMARVLGQFSKRNP